VGLRIIEPLHSPNQSNHSSAMKVVMIDMLRQSSSNYCDDFLDQGKVGLDQLISHPRISDISLRPRSFRS
jgi:hypothetical protein